MNSNKADSHHRTRDIDWVAKRAVFSTNFTNFASSILWTHCEPPKPAPPPCRANLGPLPLPAARPAAAASLSSASLITVSWNTKSRVLSLVKFLHKERAKYSAMSLMLLKCVSLCFAHRASKVLGIQDQITTEGLVMVSTFLVRANAFLLSHTQVILQWLITCQDHFTILTFIRQNQVVCYWTYFVCLPHVRIEALNVWTPKITMCSIRILKVANYILLLTFSLKLPMVREQTIRFNCHEHWFQNHKNTIIFNLFSPVCPLALLLQDQHVCPESLQPWVAIRNRAHVVVQLFLAPLKFSSKCCPQLRV